MKDQEEFTRSVAGSLVRRARRRAKLSRAELARRAGTSAAALAAIESGARQPALPTLYRILDATGFDLRVRLEPADDHDSTLRSWNQSRRPAEQARWADEQRTWVERRRATTSQ
jgi:transcriptional regulator with XRE-family HTH domain